MTPHERAREFFDEARALAPDERAAFLQAQCDDDELRREVESLLESYDNLNDFLDEPALGRGFKIKVDEGAVSGAGAAQEPEPPPRIAGYTIHSVLGAGGMGVVYLAQQHRPKREVALKVMRRGAMSRDLLKRFELETAVLARLHHPGIARIYDAGMYDDGGGARPYFAMERIEGAPLLDYISEAKFDCRARLELFARLCDAVSHAHQKGIIHRDLKPANILVVNENQPTSGRAVSGNAAQPKILDFGIARATDSDMQVTTLKTDRGEILGTLPYISPEQITGDSRALDTRCDIYSLGVVLYELLSGRRPHDLTGMTITQAARVIEEQPHTPIANLDRAFRGDLNTIVEKALEKDPQRRYQTCSDFAADVRRFLNSEPIAARPASTIYHLRKFAQRNRTLVAGMAAVFVVLVLGILGTSMGMMTAVAREREADAERRIAQAVNEFLNEDLLGGANPYHGRGADVSLRTVLDQASANVDDRFGDQPLVRAAIHKTLGQTYQGLGLYDESASHLYRAIDDFTRILGPSAEQTITARNILGTTLVNAFRNDEAEPLLTETLALARRSLGESHGETAAAYGIQAILLRRRGLPAESEAHYRRALELSHEVLGPHHRRTLVIMNNLALLLSAQNRHDEAEALLRDLVDIHRTVSGPRHPDTAFVMINLGHVLWAQSKTHPEVDALWRGAYEIRREVLGEEHHDTLTSLYAVALLADELDDDAEAEMLHRRVLELRLAALPEDNHWVMLARRGVAEALARQGRLDEAVEMYLILLNTRLHALGVDASATNRTRNRLVELLKELGDEPAARELVAHHLQLLGDAAGSDDASPALLASLARRLLTVEYEDLRDPGLALDMARRAAAESNRNDAGILDTLALALAENGRFDEAGAVQREAIALISEEDPQRRAAYESRLEELVARSSRD